MTGGSEKSAGVFLLLCLLSACAKGPGECASLEVWVHASKGRIRPEVYAELVRMKGGLPASFQNLEEGEDPSSGKYFFRAENLECGPYRCTLRWMDYLWPDEIGSDIDRPLPLKRLDLDLKPGLRRIEEDLVHDHGFSITVHGLPTALEEFVRVEVRPAGDKEGYTCCLKRLPRIRGEGRVPFFLPLHPGDERRIVLGGLLPDWNPELEGRASDPPAELRFEFPPVSLGSLDMEVFYPDGQPVAGRAAVQREDFGLPFLDSRFSLALRNMGRGRRGIDCLPEGRYRVFFFWESRESGGQGCEDLCDIEIKGQVYRYFRFEPAMVTLEVKAVPPGNCTVRIRESGGSRIVSKRDFRLPAPSPPFSMIFRPGVYEGELISEEGGEYHSGPFRVSGRERLSVTFR